MEARHTATPKSIEIFKRWFDQHGHWMFGTRGQEKALAAWTLHGIDGLPQAPANAASHLQGWLQ